VLKFVADAAPGVSREQLGSDLGRAVYDANPDRFTLDRLRMRKELLADVRGRVERKPA
jgi:hypothetical protein